MDNKMIFGEPYVFKCPHCRNLIVTSVSFGSGAVCCDKCSNGRYEPIHFDFVTKEEIKQNQHKYKDLIETYLKNNK